MLTALESWERALAPHYDEAERMLLRAIDLRPGHYRAWGVLAVVRRNRRADRAQVKDTYAKAIALGAELLKETPRDEYLLADLGSYYVLLRDRSHAIPLLRSAVDHANGRADILATAGTAFEEIGERGFALDVLGRAYRAGYAPEDVERNPLMSKLVKDPRYARIRSGSK